MPDYIRLRFRGMVSSRRRNQLGDCSETRRGELVWADTRTQNSGEVFLNMAEADGWTRLANYLAKVAGATG